MRFPVIAARPRRIDQENSPGLTVDTTGKFERKSGGATGRDVAKRASQSKTHLRVANRF
jgi:hypothetical protein